MVARTNALDADLIVLAGDYVIQRLASGTFVPPEDTARVLAGLRARHGVHAVLGNHDWWLDSGRVARALERAGIRVLEDAAACAVRRDGRELRLAAISDLWEGEHDVRTALAKVPPGAGLIAITHNPDVFPLVPRRVALWRVPPEVAVLEVR